MAGTALNHALVKPAIGENCGFKSAALKIGSCKFTFLQPTLSPIGSPRINPYKSVPTQGAEDIVNAIENESAPLFVRQLA
jgi:hypothetical protein